MLCGDDDVLTVEALGVLGRARGRGGLWAALGGEVREVSRGGPGGGVKEDG